MDDLLIEITQRLDCSDARVRPLLVAIDGPGGAGKSTLAAALVQQLGERSIAAEIVRMDDFFLPGVRRADPARGAELVGGDYDWERLRDQILGPLCRGRPAVYQRYDWGADALAEWRRISKDVQIVLVEGVYVLRLELRDYYDLSVWVTCPRAVRLARGAARDGQAARERWVHEWMPAEDRYVALHRPHLRVDFLVANADPFATTPSWHVRCSHPARH